MSSHSNKGIGSGSEPSHKRPRLGIRSAHQQQYNLVDVFPSYTLRLEHRQGGVMALDDGEERILLFRNDRAGAIAKIVYTSSTSSDASSVVQAKIVVLEVKESYRGCDFGGLLFTSAMKALRHRYLDLVDDHNNETAKKPPYIYCQLDAEEDTRRHNKLVRFYEELGCEVRNGKVVFLNNNDGETYRKVPMHITLRLHAAKQRNPLYPTLLTSRSINFLPVYFCDATGARLRRADHSVWLLMDNGDGYLELQTTKGHSLRVDVTGVCYIVADSGDRFELARDHSETLWMLESAYGFCLGIDQRGEGLRCSKDPVYWKAGKRFELILVPEEPPSFGHTKWQQSRERYLSFKLRRCSIEEALRLAQRLKLERDDAGVSLRSLCFRTAEFLRQAGHPDWVQLLGLLYHLGHVVLLLDNDKADNSVRVEDCPACSYPTQVMGCVLEGATGMVDDETVYAVGCGFENVLLALSGTEYMYQLLKWNRAGFPEEGFKMLRLASLNAWHSNGEYSELADEDDAEWRDTIADFERLLALSIESARNAAEFSSDDCDRLWRCHYSGIAEKYQVDGDLMW